MSENEEAPFGMTVYLSCYAFTRGVIKAKARMSRWGEDDVEVLTPIQPKPLLVTGEGIRWHYTFEEAQAAAEAIRAHRIEQYQRQIAELEAADLETEVDWATPAEMASSDSGKWLSGGPDFVFSGC